MSMTSRSLQKLLRENISGKKPLSVDPEQARELAEDLLARIEPLAGAQRNDNCYHYSRFKVGSSVDSPPHKRHLLLYSTRRIKRSLVSRSHPFTFAQESGARALGRHRIPAFTSPHFRHWWGSCPSPSIFAAGWTAKSPGDQAPKTERLENASYLGSGA